MEFYEVIEKRRSIRQFEDKAIPMDLSLIHISGPVPLWDLAKKERTSPGIPLSYGMSSAIFAETGASAPVSIFPRPLPPQGPGDVVEWCRQTSPSRRADRRGQVLSGLSPSGAV